MSALEETSAAATAGKSIHGQLLPVDDATRATLPQLRYADAVRAALAGIRVLPDAREVGIREEPGGGWELFLRLEWLRGHDDLIRPAMRDVGLTVEWSHLVGWLVRSGDDLVVPDIDQLADPQLVADTAMHAALCGMHCTCDKPPGDRRWEHAANLEAALAAYDERTEGAIG